MSPVCSICGGPDPESMEAAVVGTDIRGERINGAPNGVPWVRSCVACANPGIEGDNNLDSATAAAARRHSSSAILVKSLIIHCDPLLRLYFTNWV